MSIRNKMIALVLGVVLIALVTGATVYSSIKIEQAAKEQVETATEARALAGEIEAAMLRYMGSVSQVMFEIKDGEPDEASEELEEAEEADAEVGEMFEELAALSEETNADPVQALADQWQKVDDSAEQAIVAEAAEAGVSVKAGETDMENPTTDTEGLEDQLEQAEDDVEQAFDAYEKDLDTAVAQSSAEGEAASSTMYAAMAGGLGLIVLFTAVFGTWMVGSISGRLKRAEEYASAVADGNFDAEYGEHGNDEVGRMTRSVEQMKDALVMRVANMREMAGVVIVTAEMIESQATEAGQALDRAASGDEDVKTESVTAARNASAEIAQTAGTLGQLSKQMLDS